MRAIEKLKSDLMDNIVEEIPVNTTCPHCEKEIDYECIIDKNDETRTREWDRLTQQIIKTVTDALPEMIEETLNR